MKDVSPAWVSALSSPVRSQEFGDGMIYAREKDAKAMSVKPSYVYAASVLRVIDGDTIAAEVDLGFYVNVKMSLRLAGINARELRDTGGTEARDHLAGLLPAGTPIVVQSVKPDKYAGRADAVVILPNGDDLNNRLLAEGWAAPYDGTGKTSDHVPAWPRA